MGYDTEQVTAAHQIKDFRSINAGYQTALEEEISGLNEFSMHDQLLNRTKISKPMNKSFNLGHRLVSAKSKDTYHKLRLK
jgi:hypothetical protein